MLPNLPFNCDSIGPLVSWRSQTQLWKLEDPIKTLTCNLYRYDGTVRNSGGDVIQFLYGEDGMDGVAIESQKMESLRMDPKTFEVGSYVLTFGFVTSFVNFEW